MNPAHLAFIGTWRLLTVKCTSPEGRIDYPYGPSPIGRLTYDSAGRMSAQLMRSGRHAHTGIREALETYVAYFGTFDVDESTSHVIHHVEASLEPSWINGDQKRGYRFNANCLVLTAATNNVYELTWERDEGETHTDPTISRAHPHL